MTDEQKFLVHYTAPKEPPPSRHPPISSSGLIGWVRRNLFSNVIDTISTLVMLLLLGLAVYSFLDWAIFKAQWEVVFLNLRHLGAGPEFPPEQVARIEMSMYLLFFLAMLSVGFWGRLRGFVFVILALIAIATVVIPILTEPVEEPTIHYYVDAQYNIRQVNFVADEGEKLTFTLDPVTEKSEFDGENLQGYFGNEKLPNPAMDAFAAAIGEVNRGAIDPANYSLNLAIQIWDRKGQVIAQTDFSQGATESSVLEWEAPSEDWYTVTVVRAPENPGDTGIAWLKIDDLEVFYSTRTESRKRLDRFGDPPKLNCEACAISTNRTDLRFNGERSLLQWFSLQLTPYLSEIRMFYFIGLVVSMAGYGFGQVGKYSLDKKLMSRIVVGLWLASIPVHLLVVRGIGADDFLPLISTTDLGGVYLTILLSLIGILASFPIGILLALGRQSDLPVVSFLCTAFIEVVRGVPLITLLFMGRLILPYVGDALKNADLMIRIAIVLTLFTAAYLAEVIRGGLQIIPKGQTEAARALGLSEVYITTLIVLPQALRAVIPAIMGQFVSLLKDTSLVALVGLFEITGTMRRLLSDTQTGYTLFQREGYIYIGIIYFILCYVLAEVSRRLEETGAGAARR